MTVRRNKTGGGLGVAVGPQWGSGAEFLVGVKGAKPPEADVFFTHFIMIFYFCVSHYG
jgi:hypothetical protein